MVGGGLMQLVAYGAQDCYLTGGSYYIKHRNNDLKDFYKYEHKRKYNTISVLFEEVFVNNETPFNYQINMDFNNFNDKPIFEDFKKPTILTIFKKVTDKLSQAEVKLNKVERLIDKDQKRGQRQHMKAMLKGCRR